MRANFSPLTFTNILVIYSAAVRSIRNCVLTLQSEAQRGRTGVGRISGGMIVLDSQLDTSHTQKGNSSEQSYIYLGPLHVEIFPYE
jgi:hypothetical protein